MVQSRVKPVGAEWLVTRLSDLKSHRAVAAQMSKSPTARAKAADSMFKKKKWRARKDSNL
jgi:hypothetical protein